MKRNTKTTLTSDAGDVFLIETRIIGNIWRFRRHNKRPVNPPYCYDHRNEIGVRIGTWVFAIRRTKRSYAHTHPIEILNEAF